MATEDTLVIVGASLAGAKAAQTFRATSAWSSPDGSRPAATTDLSPAMIPQGGPFTRSGLSRTGDIQRTTEGAAGGACAPRPPRQRAHVTISTPFIYG